MSQFVTLSKNSPEFESYLLGTFADDKRALPVQTLNVNSSSETVTFKVLNCNELAPPAWALVALQTLRIRSFLLILVPLFLILTKNLSDETMRDPQAAILATIGVVFAFLAMNLRNDFMDHMKGVDRVFEKSGSRAIQNGWVRAITVKKLSSMFLVLAALTSLPLIYTYPDLGIVIGIAALVGMWAQFKKQNSFKYQRGGEISLFLMSGPLLTVGYQLAMGAPFDMESFWIGCVYGWLVLFVVHLKNFSNILPSSQAGFSNTVNWLGFDKSRRMLALWWGLFIGFNVIYHFNFAGFYWGFYLSLGLALISVHFVGKLKAISSPAGSEMRDIFRRGYALYLLAVGLWTFECLWYLWP
ncbi:prenyltransferase [Bdellovibrio sp. HCB2-146]|uniref:prenyltransferase n=1 Tax=Bdellovibrio sp. HCB2-146 TaxID=3394362 RepID=UPI0039BC81D2